MKLDDVVNKILNERQKAKEKEIESFNMIKEQYNEFINRMENDYFLSMTSGRLPKICTGIGCMEIKKTFKVG